MPSSIARRPEPASDESILSRQVDLRVALVETSVFWAELTWFLIFAGLVAMVVRPVTIGILLWIIAVRGFAEVVLLVFSDSFIATRKGGSNIARYSMLLFLIVMILICNGLVWTITYHTSMAIVIAATSMLISLLFWFVMWLQTRANQKTSNNSVNAQQRFAVVPLANILALGALWSFVSSEGSPDDEWIWVILAIVFLVAEIRLAFMLGFRRHLMAVRALIAGRDRDRGAALGTSEQAFDN